MNSTPSGSPVPPQPPPSGGTEKLENQIATLFIGRDGIRAGWRLLIFLAILFTCAGIGIGVYVAIAKAMHNVTSAQNIPFTASTAFAQEAILAFSMFLAAFIMSKIEKRSIGKYGLPLREAFGRLFWQGAIWGLVAISATMALIAALHGFSAVTIDLSGRVLIGYALLWGLGFLLTGFFEEFTFRGYSQFTLTTGMGFWPSAVLLSILFGALHLGNHGEAWPGALTAGLIGFFFCFTLWRTGSIWFAVGLHAAWDYGETFIYGTPDSGLVAPGHLLNSSFHGPKWITGGSVGPEASVACFIVIALLFLVFHFAYPRRAEVSRSG